MTDTAMVTVGPDVELLVRLDGDRAAPPVVILHGYIGEGAAWDPVARTVADAGFHVVRPDHRGHGGSTDVGDEAGYSFELLLADTLALVDHFGFTTFHLVGHSMGGFVAQMLAIRHGERLRSLTLVGSSPMPGSPPGRVGPPLRRFVGYRIGVARLVRWLTPLLSRVAFGSARATTREERRSALLALAEAADLHDPAAFVALGEELQHHEDLRPLLSSIDVPTLVVVGDEEVASIRAGADEQAARIPGAVFEVVAESGHGTPMDQPEEFSRLLLAHLERADVR